MEGKWPYSKKGKNESYDMYSQENIIGPFAPILQWEKIHQVERDKCNKTPYAFVERKILR